MMESARRIEPTFSDEYLNESHLKVVDNTEDVYSPAVFKPNPNRRVEIEPEPAVWSSGRTGENLNTVVPESNKSEPAQIYKFPSSEDKNLEINNDSKDDSGLEEIDYSEAVEKLRENIAVLEQDLVTLEGSGLSDAEKQLEKANIEADMAADKKVLSEYTTEAIKKQMELVEFQDLKQKTEDELILDSEQEQQKAEYLRLKHVFKDSQKEYYKAVKDDYDSRAQISKIFGLGRSSMNPQVQAAHSAFMEANSQYHKFAQSSGMYQKIAERMNREQGEGEQLSVKPLVADRHILKPAEQRLELQTLHLPESILKLKTSLMEKIKANPKTAIGVGGLALGAAAAFNLPGLIAGLATRNVTKWAGDKYIGSKERKLSETKEGMVESMDGETDLEKMEADYFKGLKDVRTAENYTTAARRVATGLAAFGAGAAYSGSVEAIDAGVDDSINAQELFNETEGIDLENMIVPDNTSELMHVVERGDTTSEIINNTIRERLATGELVLPKGVGENDISHWLYQSFPELTSASEIQPRLTPSEWMDLGISSGNPQDIKPGEMINVETLLEKMRGIGTAEIQTPVEIDPSFMEESVDVAQNTPDIPADSQVYEAATATDVSPEVLGGTETVEQIPNSPDSADVSPEPSVAIEGALETSSYTPYVSEALMQQSHQFSNPEAGSLHKYLAETMLREYRGHSINLPTDTAMRVYQNDTALYGFIEKHIPDLSTNWFSKTLRGGPDMFTAEDWVNYGIKSGDPTNIAPGEVVKTGEIIKRLLEIAGGKVNKI